MRAELDIDELTPRLRALAQRCDDLSPAMQDIGEAMIQITQAHFKSGTSPDGVPWAPKSANTIARYLSRGDRADSRPLHGPSGALRGTIAAQPTRTSVAWGSNMIYAAVMQLGAAKGAFGRTSRGASIPWGTIPARPFLGIGPKERSAISEILIEHLGAT